MKIFVLNSGGSSVKFKILEMPAEEEIASGKVEKLGSSDAIFHLNYNNNKLKESWGSNKFNFRNFNKT